MKKSNNTNTYTNQVDACGEHTKQMKITLSIILIVSSNVDICYYFFNIVYLKKKRKGGEIG